MSTWVHNAQESTALMTFDDTCTQNTSQSTTPDAGTLQQGLRCVPKSILVGIVKKLEKRSYKLTVTLGDRGSPPHAALDIARTIPPMPLIAGGGGRERAGPHSQSECHGIVKKLEKRSCKLAVSLGDRGSPPHAARDIARNIPPISLRSGQPRPQTQHTHHSQPHPLTF